MQRILVVILYPISLLYNAITALRNYFFQRQYGFRSIQFDIPTINVGNLRVGGTGKTPHVEYLIELLMSKYKIGTLSRGYGRKTKGFLLADEQSTAQTVGDEPLQFYSKYKNDITVSVGEDRALAIPQLLGLHPEIEVLLLDDAYQHRYVKPHLNVLLTEYARPFYRDFVLPSGRLRENRLGANRADIVVVTKCPSNLTDQEMEHVTKKVARYSKGDVCFSCFDYAEPVGKNDEILNHYKKVVTVAGIANNQSFIDYVAANYSIQNSFNYSDHYNYQESDVIKWLSEVKKESGTAIVTTEKDFMRLKEFEELKTIPLFYIPIKVKFLSGKDTFEKLVHGVIDSDANSL